MLASPSTSSGSYRKTSGKHLKTGTIDFLSLFVLALSSEMDVYEVDIPKAVLIILPIVFSKARRTAQLLGLLKAGAFNFDPQLSRRFPQEDWNQLLSSCYTACKLAANGNKKWMAIQSIITEPGVEVGTSSRPSGVGSMSSLRGVDRMPSPRGVDRVSRPSGSDRMSKFKRLFKFSKS